MPPKGTKRARAGRLAAVTTRSASARRSASPSPVPSGAGHDDLDDDFDDDFDDDLDQAEAHPTMRDLYALLKEQTKRMEEQTQRIAELASRSQDGASSSSRDPVKSIEDDARALLSVALSDSASQRYQNYDVKLKVQEDIKEKSRYNVLERIAAFASEGIIPDGDVFDELPRNVQHLLDRAQTVFFRIEELSSQRVAKLDVEIQIAVWIDQLGPAFKEVFERVHANHGGGIDSIQKSITEAVACLRAQRDLQAPRGGGGSGGGGGGGGGRGRSGGGGGRSDSGGGGGGSGRGDRPSRGSGSGNDGQSGGGGRSGRGAGGSGTGGAGRGGGGGRGNGTTASSGP